MRRYAEIEFEHFQTLPIRCGSALCTAHEIDLILFAASQP